jgi:diaminopimelate epimerase
MTQSASSSVRPFRKMHGLGNDFVLFDARQSPVNLTAAQVRALSNRQTGIGCDQLIVLEPSARADLFMRIYNADGSEVGACGNASRCVAALEGKAITIETSAGLLRAQMDHGVATVDMGEPRFGWADIPLAYAMDTLRMPLAWEDLVDPVAVNVGNPHVVFFVRDPSVYDLARLGPIIEHDPVFPERVNVNLACVRDRMTIDLVVWERGAGLTLACGTGACATAVSAMRCNLTDRAVKVRLPGGDLQILWAPDNHIHMTGDVATAFEGSVDLASYRL